MKLKPINSVIIVEHEANDVGPGHILIQYFNKRKIDELIYIDHPNLYIKSGFKKSSRINCFRSGTSVWKRTGYHWVLPEWALYIKDVIYTIFWVICLRKKYDIFIGLGNINALCGCLLKILRKTDRTVYYVIDYIPQRFTNPIMNWIYHVVDKFAADYSDSTWNLSPRMIEGREQRWNKKFSNQLIVPHGLHIDKKKILPYNKINKYELIYMGNLNKEQGIQLVISSLNELAAYIPKISFSIIGVGNYEKELKYLVKKNNLSAYVRFFGRIRDNNHMENRLAKAALAIAMYNPDHKFSVYSDPGKIKHYLSVGLPIIMTDLPQIAEKINNYCGEAILYDKHLFISTVKNLLKNQHKLLRYRKNAFQLAKEYDWNKIYEEALNKLSFSVKVEE